MSPPIGKLTRIATGQSHIRRAVLIQVPCASMIGLRVCGDSVSSLRRESAAVPALGAKPGGFPDLAEGPDESHRWTS